MWKPMLFPYKSYSIFCFIFFVGLFLGYQDLLGQNSEWFEVDSQIRIKEKKREEVSARIQELKKVSFRQKTDKEEFDFVQELVTLKEEKKSLDEDIQKLEQDLKYRFPERGMKKKESLREDVTGDQPKNSLVSPDLMSQEPLKNPKQVFQEQSQNQKKVTQEKSKTAVEKQDSVIVNQSMETLRRQYQLQETSKIGQGSQDLEHSERVKAAEGVKAPLQQERSPAYSISEQEPKQEQELKQELKKEQKTSESSVTRPSGGGNPIEEKITISNGF
jgi:hypothetical protein